ncbi:DMT family transporter [Desulfovibrionales bacterium]
MQRSPSVIYVLLVVVFAIWGGGMVAMKFALESFSIIHVVFARVGIAAIFYLCILRVWRTFPYQKGDWKYFAILVGFEPCLLFICETSSLAYTSASQAGVIAACFPLTTALAGWIFLSERMTGKTISGMLVAVIGVAGASYFADATEAAPAPLLGNSLMGMAVLSATGYAICVRFISQRYSFFTISAIQAIGGCLAFLPFLFFSGLPGEVSAGAIGGVLYLGIGVGILAYLGFNFALEKLPAGQVALFGNLIPLFTLFFAFTLLHERLTATQSGFVALALAGLIWAALPGSEGADVAPVPRKQVDG